MHLKLKPRECQSKEGYLSGCIYLIRYQRSSFDGLKSLSILKHLIKYTQWFQIKY